MVLVPPDISVDVLPTWFPRESTSDCLHRPATNHHRGSGPCLGASKPDRVVRQFL